MRILFMGTAAFVVPSLERLIGAGHELLGVITQPDRPVGRKRVLQPSPVKSAAQAQGLPVFQPERLRRDRELHDAVRAMAPDVVAYAAYGQIIPPSFLEIPRLGCWNVHGSLLPAYRGAAPIQRAIMNGERTTGVSVMIAEAGLDTGPVLASRKMEILPADTAGTLGERMAGIGAQLLVDTLSAWDSGSVIPRPQDEAAATYAPSIEKEDARIDWSRPSTELGYFVRSLNPRPGAWTMWRGQEFKVWEAIASDAPGPGPGRLAVVSGRPLVGTGAGSLQLVAVQPSGKRPMAAADWARGLRDAEAFDI